MQDNVTLDSFEILIVDDNVQIRDMLRSMCRAVGLYAVRCCARVDQAWSLMQARLPDVVLTDWEMEPESGFSFLSAIRANSDPRIASLPVIMITSYADQDRVVAAKDAGASFFLKKPVSIRALQERIVATMPATETGRALIVASLKEAQHRTRQATAALEDLRARYVAGLPAQLEQLRAAFAAVESSTVSHDGELRRLFGLLHDLKGQGAMFGFPLLTLLSRPLCEILRGREDLELAERNAIEVHLDAMDLVVRHRIETYTLGDNMMAHLATVAARARAARNSSSTAAA